MKLTLLTDRLILRPFTKNDADNIFMMWANDDEVTKYLTWNSHKNINDTKEILDIWIEQYEKPERLNFAITLKEENILIGGIDVVGYLENVPVIGYVLSKPYWNNGYMTEACKCLLNYLFEQGYKEVRIDAVEENIGSNKVIQKCGGILINSTEEFIKAKNRYFKINQYIVYKRLD